MKHVKRIETFARAGAFAEKDNAPLPFAVYLILFLAAGAIIVILTASGRIDIVWGYALSAVCFACAVVYAAVTVYFLRLPFGVVLDGEHLFIRKGGGYLKFHKYEIGRVIYRTESTESVALGSGADNFLLTKSSLTFQSPLKRITVRVKNGEKLAYILMNTVEAPDFGADWSVAYESLPKDKRSPLA